MRPYGERKKIKTAVRGHSECRVCHPKEVFKGKERTRIRDEIKKLDIPTIIDNMYWDLSQH